MKANLRRRAFSSRYREDASPAAGRHGTSGKLNGYVCAFAADGGRDICQFPILQRERERKILRPKPWPKSYSYHQSSLSGGQNKNPSMNDTTIAQHMPNTILPLKPRKNPLTQPAITVNLKMSKNAFEMLSRLLLLNNFIDKRLSHFREFVKGPLFPRKQSPSLRGANESVIARLPKAAVAIPT